MVDRLFSAVIEKVFNPYFPSMESSVGDPMNEEIIGVAFSNIFMVYTRENLVNLLDNWHHRL